MKNYICTGERMQVTLTADATSGSVVIVGAKAGIAVTSGKVGEVIVVQTEGVFELPKSTGAIAQGAKVYFDATNSVVTTTATSNTLLGYAFVAAASADTVCQVNIVDNP